MGLKFFDFKNSLEAGCKYSVFLMEGEDAFFRERGLDLLKDRYVSEPALNLAVFDGAGVNAKELYSSVTGYPFMSKKRLTVIREFYPDKNILKELGGYLENPPGDSMLVILNEKPSESLKKFQSVCVVDCGRAEPALLIKWIRAECAKYDVVIEGDAARKIAEYCLSDMTRIKNETHKLVSYAGKHGVLKSEAVDALVSRDTEYKIYEMTDYIGKKKHDSALSVVKDLLSKGETPQRLLVSIYNYFRRLLHVVIADAADTELASMLGIKEFAVKKTREQARLFKVHSLKKAVDELCDADYAIKSGRTDVNDAFWLSLFAIMAE